MPETPQRDLLAEAHEEMPRVRRPVGPDRGRAGGPVMPYVVTTKSRWRGANDLGYWAVLSRHAVATLEGAQVEARRIVNTQRHRRSDPLWNNAIESWPASGGTVGPLPSGETIKVDPWTESAFRVLCAQHHIDGFDTLPLADLIAAYNTKQAGQ